TWADLEDVRGWIKYRHQIISNPQLKKFLKQGYRVLFHGPPGTGKTMTAAILAKEAGLDLYQVDLSTVVSKYIGETEKNLAAIFDTAENKDWILFFDEADALFGKRSQIQSSNDQYANQQVAYLLQRIEDYNGIVVLATNFKENIDAAFIRRFQSVVYFPKPKVEQRLRLWENYFSGTFEIQLDLESIAAKYEITGGSMVNVLRYCAIAAYNRGNNTIYQEDVYRGIHKEFLKEGITV
ncbi:MAG TPA: ATP-binding protein, partial [Cytophagales bacterium]|nr:ATP-binding protein [Cytophagales bacterium]